MSDLFIHDTAVVDEGAVVQDGTSIWHFSHVMPEAEIGSGCTLGQNVYIDRNVKIGHDVKIQNNVSVYQGVTLHDHVFCGPSMVFTNVNNPRSQNPTNEDEYEETVVYTGATIGANATIICGNNLGRWCFIGAGSVITEPVPAFALFTGNPATHSGWACVCGELNHSIDNGEWDCPSCSRSYRYKNTNQSEIELDNTSKTEEQSS